jgi:hypothetical protein
MQQSTDYLQIASFAGRVDGKEDAAVFGGGGGVIDPSAAMAGLSVGCCDDGSKRLCVWRVVLVVLVSQRSLPESKSFDSVTLPPITI